MSNRKELIERQNMKEDTKNSREINYVYIISENEMQSWLLPLSLSTTVTTQNA